jgi:hypothetical protein
MIRPADAKLKRARAPLQAVVSFVGHDLHQDGRIKEFGR